MLLDCALEVTIRNSTTNSLCVTTFVAVNANYHVIGNAFRISFAMIAGAINDTGDLCDPQ